MENFAKTSFGMEVTIDVNILSFLFIGIAIFWITFFIWGVFIDKIANFRTFQSSFGILFKVQLLGFWNWHFLNLIF